MSDTTSNGLPHAWGTPPLHGRLRVTPEDFVVEEDLGFEADGAGEHLLVLVEKRGANTEWAARSLAQFAGVGLAAVSYAGLKDRHAVARQTFSLHLPGRADPDWSRFAAEGLRVLTAQRHGRKLKHGALKGNRFRITIRDAHGDRALTERVLGDISRLGVPNYFGEQRFGRDSDNVAKALAMFAGRRVKRHERSLLLSAARSQLFNAALAARVERGDWNLPLDGEVWMLAGSHSIFGPEALTDALRQRHANGDIDLTGPLWGEGELRSRGVVAELEAGIARDHAELADGLVKAGLSQQRRALRLRPRNISWRWLNDTSIELGFYLQSGSYATVITREICA